MAFNTLGTKQTRTINNFTTRLNALKAFVDTIPVDSTSTHLQVPVASLVAETADTLAPISSASKAKLQAQVQRIIDTFIDGIQENNFIS